MLKTKKGILIIKVRIFFVTEQSREKQNDKQKSLHFQAKGRKFFNQLQTLFYEKFSEYEMIKLPEQEVMKFYYDCMT